MDKVKIESSLSYIEFYDKKKVNLRYYVIKTKSEDSYKNFNSENFCLLERCSRDKEFMAELIKMYKEYMIIDWHVLYNKHRDISFCESRIEIAIKYRDFFLLSINLFFLLVHDSKFRELISEDLNEISRFLCIPFLYHRLQVLGNYNKFDREVYDISDPRSWFNIWLESTWRPFRTGDARDFQIQISNLWKDNLYDVYCHLTQEEIKMKNKGYCFHYEELESFCEINKNFIRNDPIIIDNLLEPVSNLMKLQRLDDFKVNVGYRDFYSLVQIIENSLKIYGKIVKKK